MHVPCRAVLPRPAFLSVCEPSTCRCPYWGPPAQGTSPAHGLTSSRPCPTVLPFLKALGFDLSPTSPHPHPGPRPPPGRPQGCPPLLLAVRWKRSRGPGLVRPLLPLGLLPSSNGRWLRRPAAGPRAGPGARVAACGTSPRCAALSDQKAVARCPPPQGAHPPPLCAPWPHDPCPTTRVVGSMDSVGACGLAKGVEASTGRGWRHPKTPAKPRKHPSTKLSMGSESKRPSRKQVRHPPPPSQPGAGKMHCGPGEGLPVHGSFREEPRKWKVPFSQGMGGVLLQGPQMNHLRAGKPP